jgi:hypothetical protein
MGSITVPLTSFFDWFGISCMTTDNFCFYLQNRPVKPEVNGTVILPPLVFPSLTLYNLKIAKVIRENTTVITQF